MIDEYKISGLLLASIAQTIEELMHGTDEENVQPDHQAVLDEVHELLKGEENASEEEGADTPVQEQPSVVDAEVVSVDEEAADLV